MKKVLSVITICYNAKSTIEQAISSVAAQKNDEIEYVVIDGGSTDGTLDLIKMHESDIDVIVSEPDYGIADAFNKGVQYSSGEYIAFLNADDYYEPAALVEVLKELRVAKEDLVYGNANRVAVSGEVSKKVSSSKLELSLPFSHCAAFLSRSYFERFGGFNVAVDVAMDIDLLLRGYSKISKKHVGITVANQRDGGVSDKNRLKGYYQYFLFYALYRGFWKGLRGYVYKILVFYFRKVVK